MAPEQCVPDGDIGPAADVGNRSTLYYAVTAQRPFPKPASTAPGVEPELRFPQLVENVKPSALPVPNKSSPDLSSPACAARPRSGRRRRSSPPACRSLTPPA